MAYPWYRVFASVACLVVALALYAVVNRTRLGMMIRAGASNRDMVRGLGIDIRRLYRIVFAGGVALAALAGMIAAPMSSVYPGMGASVLIICFVVVVIGGIGSITGALVASLLVGFVDTFGKVFFAGVERRRHLRADGGRPGLAARRPDEGRWRLSASRRAGADPADGIGRRGRRLRVRRRCRCRPLRSRSCRSTATSSAQIADLRDLRAQPGAAGRRRPGWSASGHAAFFGIGAYATVLASGAAGALDRLGCCRRRSRRRAPRYALVVGALSLRTRGVYFIMVTLAFAQMAFFVFHDTPARRRQRRHLPLRQARPALGAHRPGRPRAARALYYVVLPRCLVATYALPRAPAALALRPRAGGHPRQRAAHARRRLPDLSLQARRLRRRRRARRRSPASCSRRRTASVNPELLGWHESGAVLLMVILGGLGSLRGAVIGAVAFTLLKELLPVAGAGRPAARSTGS